MEKLTQNHQETKSADVVEGNIDKLKTLFPEIFTEGKVSLDALKQLLGESIADGEEKYGLNWHGKRRAKQVALTPSTGTLRPLPDDGVNWDNTSNLLIEGDNLEVLKLLQKSYAGRVKLIYIDPPYNTGKDFVYPDDYRDNIKNYLNITGQKLVVNTDANGRFHTDWLNMMYPRLKLARSLLRSDGVIFISIDDREYANLRTICSEIFGEENIIGTLVWKNSTDNNPTNIAIEHEYMLVLAKGKDGLESEWKSAVSDVKELLIKVGNDLTSKYKGDELKKEYDTWFRQHKSELSPLDRYKYIDEHGVYTGSQSVHNPGKEGYRYDVIHPDTKLPCKQPLMGYRFPKETMDQLLEEGRILFGDDESKIIELKVYASEYQEKLASVIDLDGRLGSYDLKDDFTNEGKVFNNPKPVRLLNSFLPFILKNDGDIVLDFFAGSGTTAKAVFEMNKVDGVNRRFILVQLPEPIDPDAKEQKAAAKLCQALGKPANLAELTKERIRRVAKKHALGDSKLDFGFRVFKLDSSNIRSWEPDTDDIAASLLDSTEHIKNGRSEQDILYELLIKLGLDLAVPVESKTIEGKDVHSIGAGALIACLPTSITREQVEPLAMGIIAWHREEAPSGEVTVVFRDSAFADDVAKTNMAAILSQHGLTTVRSL